MIMFTHTTPKCILLCCALALPWLWSFQDNAPILPPVSVSSFSYSILPGSRISILGTTNISEFTCFSDETSAIKAGAFLFNDVRSTIAFQQTVLNLTTQSLECGNKAMNHNLYETLNSEKFPFIVIDLRQVTSKNGSPLKLSSKTAMTAQVYISLAGVRRLNQINFTGEQTGSGTYHFTGSHDISFTDYNIDPPSAMFGLVKVSNRITVRFDLKVSANAEILQ